MADKITVYRGRENQVRLTLYEKKIGATSWTIVEPNTLDRAVFRFGSFCVDTDVPGDSDKIAFASNNQCVDLYLGLIDGLLAPRTYTGHLTAYETNSDYGKAWHEFRVSVEEWPVCEAA